MKTKYTLLFVLMMFVFSDCKKEADIAPQNIEQELAYEIQAKGIPSVAACIVSGKQIEWEWVYGHANIQESKPATRQTLYHIMSISKIFIAISVMQLLEENKLSLEDDINLHLPYQVRNPNYPNSPITIKMLLTHTSSLAWPNGENWEAEFCQLFPGDEMPRISEWLPEYILPGGSSYRSNIWKEYKPGEKELYSNIATSLLAFIVEQVSGLDYMEYVKANILVPLEMYNTTFLYSEADTQLLAVPYFNSYAAYPHYNYRHYPAGNLKSNLEDFSHFMIAMLNEGRYNGKQILEPSSFEKMFELNNISTGVGLIWRHCPGDCVGHSGGGQGFSARFEIYPDRNKAMVIFSNRYNISVYPQGRIYDLLRLKTNQF